MSSLITLQGLSKSYGSKTLFTKISLGLFQGGRVGLVGPNGAGKSTLLKILAGLESADEGSVVRRSSLRIGYCSQAPEFEAVPLETLLMQQVPEEDPSVSRTRAHILLSKAQFSDFLQKASELSGGWKKRLDIVRALMCEPDLLLLDEPTNHLDIEGILWLEKFLRKEKAASLIVSHDRYFLDNVATKIIELNRCYPQGVFMSEGNLSRFIENKEAFLLSQAQEARSLAAQVQSEIEWLKKSPKARTTKSRSRIENAHAMMEELAEINERNKTHKVDISFSASERETRKLLVAKNITKSLGGKLLFKGIDLVLSPGMCLGIVGKNGTGKTTLLKLLAGELEQDMGTIKYAKDVRIVYFDQHRQAVASDIPLREALSPNGDFVSYRGQSIHVNGWARKFLFSPDRLLLPVSRLSGGEKARILLAKLLLEPADILFLDEPTNDLDIPTLQVIEESLREFAGAVVLISHDRCLMDSVCTQILGLGSDNEQQFFADYSQWESACMRSAPKKEESVVREVAPPVEARAKKLSYKEQKELEGMESAIMAAEEKVLMLQKQLEETGAPELYQQLADGQIQLEKLFERWEVLTKK